MTVRARFAFWQEAIEDVPAYASYIIIESDVYALPIGGNVDGDALLAAGVPLPVTPTLQTWINAGRPVYRGESTRRQA